MLALCLDCSLAALAKYRPTENWMLDFSDRTRTCISILTSAAYFPLLDISHSLKSLAGDVDASSRPNSSPLDSCSDSGWSRCNRWPSGEPGTCSRPHPCPPRSAWSRQSCRKCCAGSVFRSHRERRIRIFWMVSFSSDSIGEILSLVSLTVGSERFGVEMERGRKLEYITTKPFATEVFMPIFFFYLKGRQQWWITCAGPRGKGISMDTPKSQPPYTNTYHSPEGIDPSENWLSSRCLTWELVFHFQLKPLLTKNIMSTLRLLV